MTTDTMGTGWGGGKGLKYTTLGWKYKKCGSYQEVADFLNDLGSPRAEETRIIYVQGGGYIIYYRGEMES